MNKCNKFKEANDILSHFLLHKIINYERFRNYDYGPKKITKVVSGLSPYISRGILKEETILKKINNSENTSEKFIQEILWRTYWKGWLEQNKVIWINYKKTLHRKLEDIYSSDINHQYKLAIEGKTKLEPFDDWVRQLKNTGYLHNHCRMWFASIWIFYLELPWELGAHFFYENLLDADIASNTLSWRWVAGIQTRGKKYIANKENINKYTFSRFKNFSLPEIKDIQLKENNYAKNEIIYSNITDINNKKINAIFVIENNLNFNFIKKYKDKVSVVILLKIKVPSVKKNIFVQNFINDCCDDFMKLCNSKNINVKEIDLNNDFKLLLNFIKSKNISNIYSDFITVGYEKDIFIKLKEFLLQHEVTPIEILEPFYKDAWSYCNKGFFNFKKKFINNYY